MRAPEAPTSVLVTEELYSTADGAGTGLFEALREVAQARGFAPIAPDAATSAASAARMIALTSPTVRVPGGARARADFGPHAQPIAAAAARKLGASVTLVSVSGTASDVGGRLVIALTARAVRVAAAGKATELSVQAADLDYEGGEPRATKWSTADLERAGYDHAGLVLGNAARSLGLSVEQEIAERIVFTLRRPTGTPRVEEVASLIALGSAHELVPQPDGRVLVRITLPNGKRVAFLSAAEASELRAQLGRE